ncbi:kinesin-like protein KIF20B isoform X6 [Cyprinodon tularosa]|uniref:kinesin-like protein KIF20B isoform X6 n=1 Tax=Cyprinodon tularosa TaxID=77115 RepID=UPI0018E25A41|nr:kinesin-like protein KIF20B isoform X6 [Cyprinodon tularosa]
MTDCCTSNKPDQQGPSEDGNDDLSTEFSTLPQLQNSCIEDKENLQVYLRIRPFTSTESSAGESQDCVTIEPPDRVLLKPPSSSLLSRLSVDKSFPQTGQRFQFSKVYGPETTQSELFEGTVRDLVKDVLEGGNSLVFTYGVTNSGKTFTFLGPDSEAGILPRSLHVIFSSIQEHVFQELSVKPHRCREFMALSWERQAEEALFKRNLLKQFRENEKLGSSQLNITNQSLLEGSMATGPNAAAEEKISLNVDPSTKFSVWVSFCEIYNENIHDLLEVAPSGAPRRPALRLSQDGKGNAFIRDLRWVQVSSAEEAYMVVQLGRRNQSFSSTRLNQLSSRSHSIFSIRILGVEDADPARVRTISELCLCDLAGSERCAKTQNIGERLKEAGNINTSLLILGKCIKALRHNQQAKLLQHVPFRESKLTHYLQSFFCGRGKACMIVNINQCASMYEETLNVLKFSAVAQKVIVLISRPLPILPRSSSIRSTDRSHLSSSSSSSLTSWETSLQEVQEDEEEEEGSLLEELVDEESEDEDKILISKRLHQRQVALFRQLQVQLKKERAENLTLEARVREEISKEFSQLFSNMQNDYDERLNREREILEERAERRLEIFRNLTEKMSSAACSSDGHMDGSLISEPTGKQETTEAPFCSGSGGTDHLDDRTGAEERLEMKPPDHHQNHETKGEASETEEEERQRLLLELQAKSQRVEQLEEQQRNPEKVPQDGDQLQAALAALNKERTQREEMLAALEYQTLGKEEALACLQEERKAREEAVVALEELRRKRDELLASLEEERQEREKTTAALEAERRNFKEASRPDQDNQQKMLQQEVDKRQDQTESRLKAAAAELEEKSSQIQILTQEVQRLQELLQTSAGSAELNQNQLMEEISELRKSLAEEKKKNETKQKLIQELEAAECRQQDSDQQRELLANKMKETQAALEQQVQDLRVQLDSQRETSHQEADQLREKIQEQEETLKELRAQLESQHQSSKQEAERLRAALQEQTQASEQQVLQLNEKLQEQKVSLVEELEQKLREETAASIEGQEELKQKLREEQEAAEKLRKDLKEAQLHSATVSSSAGDLHGANSDLQREITSLKEELVATREESSECKQMMKEKDQQMQEKLAQMEKASAQREAELQEKLQEAEQQVSALQKSLQEAKERREEEECQAVQEVRRKETERRRELLAVAHEAVAQKDAELEKKAEELSRLKENAQQEAAKVKNLSLELQRKEDELSGQQEKLADYKKQIQQVQKEISARREEEKALQLKLADVEKAKKQLQSDLSIRDRTIQQLRGEKPDTKSDQTLQLYKKACEELEAKQRVIEDMRLTLTEQEKTEEQMEEVLEGKMDLIQELSAEVEKLKGKLLQQNHETPLHGTDGPSEDLRLAKDEASQAQESLKAFMEKQQAERKKWQEEKLSLIGQAKEAEDKRNQEMRKFAEDRERCCRQQNLLESKLVEKEKAMESWRKDRDALVAALEVQLQKLLSSQAEKDQLIKELQKQSSKQPAEVNDGGNSPRVAELQAALKEKEAEILLLKETLQASDKQSGNSTVLAEKPKAETSITKPERMETRASGSSRGSSGFPSVLESSEISTDNGRTSRFPRPELEISFSPLQPNRMALRRQGEEGAVTVKITRSARKRKSGEMEKCHIFKRSKRRTPQEQEEVEAENRRNTKTKLTPKRTPQKEESSSPAHRHDSKTTVRSRKDGTLQKIGDFLQSSPTLLGSKAKKMMSLVSGRLDADSAASSSSHSLRAKRSRKKLYRPEISCPMEMPPHPMINQERDDSESDDQIIKRRLRSRVAKC